MPQQLVDKHERADGTPVVQVETPVYFTKTDAARALALVYAGRPVMKGERAVQAGLNWAGQERVLEKPGAKPEEALVTAYMPVLERHWNRFFKYDSDENWVGGGNGVKARFDVATWFSLEEAAEALALVYGQVPKRWGRMTCERGLHQAARERVLSRPHGKRKPDAELVERFRAIVREVGMFTR